MISIPLKLAKAVDVSRPIANYIQSKYTAEEVKSTSDSLAKLQQARVNAVSVSSGGPVSEGIILDYYNLLNSIGDRFPIAETNIKIDFTWHDIYTGKKYTSYNIKFEKAAILFNLAAVKSQSAASAEKTSEDSIKKCVQEFQEAAGLFEYVQNELASAILDCKSQDLSADALTMAKCTMLAQAQSCAFAKVRNKSENPFFFSPFSL
jgi:hypothetical protein